MATLKTIKTMKNYALIFILGFLVLCFSGFSQTKTFVYTYDDSGNREHREYITLKSGEAIAGSENSQPEVFEVVLNDFDIIVYPNPTKGNLKVEFTNLGNEEVGISVFNLEGKLISNQFLKGTSCAINLFNQSPGIYLMKIQIGDKSKEFKIIKE